MISCTHPITFYFLSSSPLLPYGAAHREVWSFSYTLSLLEAGHMSQNILLSATALGLHTRPMADFKDDLVVRLLYLSI